MRKCGIYQKVMTAVNCLADYSRQLIQDVDSNIVKHYNSAIEMFTGGKLTYLVQRDSYRNRCAAAVVKYNYNTFLQTSQIHHEIQPWW